MLLFVVAGTVWAQAGSMTFNEIFEKARAFNPGLRAAQQKVSEATSHVREIAGQGRPGLSLNALGSLSHGNLPDPIETENFYTYQGELILNIPNWAKSSASNRAARSQLLVAQLELNRTYLALQYQAEDTYYGYLKGKDALEIADKNLDQAERQVADTQKRIDAGDIPPADVLKAQVPELQSRASRDKAQYALNEAGQTLNSFIGRPLSETVAVAEENQSLSYEISEEDATALILKNSPDVLEAVANVEIAKANLDSVKRANDPQLSLQATQTHTSDTTTWMNLSSIGLSLSIPLFDNGVLREQVRQAQSQVDQARSALEGARQTATLAAHAALLDLRSARADYATATKVLEIAEESSRKATQSYEAGLTTTRDVLDAQIEAAQARSDANNARFALILAIAKLKQTLGEPLF
jgi:outer membrane protein TolC